MNRTRRIFAWLLLAAFVCGGTTGAQAQRRTRQRTQTPATRSTGAPQAADSRLTGLYRLDVENSDDPMEAAERATSSLAFGMDQSEIERLAARLTSPEQLAIERRGTAISIASTRAPRIMFEASGRERVERTARGREVRTRAVLYGDELMVSYTGSDRDDEFSVTFDPLDEGRRLRVTRRIYDSRINRPVVVQSIYNKISTVARWSVYGEPDSTQVASRRSRPVRPPQRPSQDNVARTRTQPPPPAVTRDRVPEPLPAPPARPRDDGFFIGGNTQFVAVLNNNLSTAETREGDPFTMTVREPRLFEGAVLEGYVSRVNRGGRIAGRAEMAFTFERIRLADGRTAAFEGYIEEVRTTGGDEARVDSEGGGSVEERDNPTNRTVERTAIGAAIGAIIGAIADGGKGAAIGAAIGAAAGAGSVYVQDRDELELRSGTEIIVRAKPQRSSTGG